MTKGFDFVLFLGLPADCDFAAGDAVRGAGAADAELRRFIEVLNFDAGADPDRFAGLT